MNQTKITDNLQSYCSKKANSIRSKLLLFSHIHLKTEQKKPTYQTFPSFPKIEKFLIPPKISSQEEETQTTFIGSTTFKVGHYSNLIKANEEKAYAFFSPFSQCSYSTDCDEAENDNNEENIFINTKKISQIGKVEHKQIQEKFFFLYEYNNESLQMKREENDKENLLKYSRGRLKTTMVKEVEEMRKKINEYFKEKEMEKSLSEKGFSFLKVLCKKLKKPKVKKNKKSVQIYPEPKTPKLSLFQNVTKFPASKVNENIYAKANNTNTNCNTNSKINTSINNIITKTKINEKKARSKSKFKSKIDESKGQTLKSEKCHRKNFSEDFEIIVLKPMNEKTEKKEPKEREKNKGKEEEKTKKKDSLSMKKTIKESKRKTNKELTEFKSCFNPKTLFSNKKENNNRSKSKIKK